MFCAYSGGTQGSLPRSPSSGSNPPTMVQRLGRSIFQSLPAPSARTPSSRSTLRSETWTARCTSPATPRGLPPCCGRAAITARPGTTPEGAAPVATRPMRCSRMVRSWEWAARTATLTASCPRLSPMTAARHGRRARPLLQPWPPTNGPACCVWPVGGCSSPVTCRILVASNPMASDNAVRTLPSLTTTVRAGRSSPC